MKKIILVWPLLLGILGFGLVACENTWHGAGRDVENIGEDMQQQYRD